MIQLFECTAIYYKEIIFYCIFFKTVNEKNGKTHVLVRFRAWEYERKTCKIIILSGGLFFKILHTVLYYEGFSLCQKILKIGKCMQNNIILSKKMKFLRF